MAPPLALAPGIYANKLGLLGGINFAILVAKTCQWFPTASAAKVVRMFFHILSEWKWPRPVLLTRIDYANSMGHKVTASPRSCPCMPWPGPWPIDRVACPCRAGLGAHQPQSFHGRHAHHHARLPRLQLHPQRLPRHQRGPRARVQAVSPAVEPPLQPPAAARRRTQRRPAPVRRGREICDRIFASPEPDFASLAELFDFFAAHKKFLAIEVRGRCGVLAIRELADTLASG